MNEFIQFDVAQTVINHIKQRNRTLRNFSSFGSNFNLVSVAQKFNGNLSI